MRSLDATERAVHQQFAGLRVLIARPRRQEDPLARALVDGGARVLALPVMRIEPFADLAPAPFAAADHIAHYHKVIVVSRHAARLASPLLSSVDQPGLQYFAVGPSTADVLRDHGIDARSSREATSEGLLALPELAAPVGQRVLILRGAGGRQTLRESLVDRGALVDCRDLYRRVVDAAHSAAIAAELADPNPLLIVAHSAEVVAALVAVAGGNARLRTLPLVVPSQRVAQWAQEGGFAKPLVAASALAGDMAAAIAHWYTEI